MEIWLTICAVLLAIGVLVSCEDGRTREGCHHGEAEK